MTRVTVIANCHCLSIARNIEQIVPRTKADFIDVNFLSQEKTIEKLADLDKDDGHRIIVSLLLGDEWSKISSNLLRDRYKSRFRTFTNIHFLGLQPDITYIGAMGSRVTAIMQDYHSKIVLYAFASGISATDCIKMFCGETYEKVGYFQMFEDSAAELIRRDDRCDIQFAGAFLDMTRQVLPLLTVNHPTAPIFASLVRTIANEVGLDCEEVNAAQLPSYLADNCIWPVYHEIAEHHNLPYRTSQNFSRPVAFQPRSLDLRDFVVSSYRAYSRLTAAEVRRFVSALDFFPKFQEALG